MFSMSTIMKQAAKAQHYFAFHVAVLTRGGSIVATGYNHGWIHAEHQALQKIWPNKRTGLVLWSFRVTGTGKLVMAKPCPKCEKLLLENGIHQVRYSNGCGEMVRMKLGG
jgi:deoxycytidylate deaminase